MLVSVWMPGKDGGKPIRQECISKIQILYVDFRCCIYIFFLKMQQKKWQNKAHIYIRQYVQIRFFLNSDLKQV